MADVNNILFHIDFKLCCDLCRKCDNLAQVDARHGVVQGHPFGLAFVHTPIGRPQVPAAKVAEIRRLRASGMGIVRTAKTVGVGSSVVQRLEV